METTGIREYMQRFQDDGYKTWIKTTMILECLKTRLGVFLENETDAFHTALNGNIKSKQTKCIHQPKCEFRNGKTNQVPLCSVCDAWRNAILAKHTSKSLVYWNNSTPHLWPSHKWEVAKVYMPRGNQKHKSVDDFDISAFLTLMTFCKHFQNFVTTKLLCQVTYVRNQVMHSASFKVSAEDFLRYVGLIRDLVEALGAKVPEFQNFSKDIAEIQNIDFQLQLIEHQGYDDNNYSWNNILNMELQIMKDKMECLSQNSRSGAENMLTSEDLQMVRGFLNVNQDLQEKLKPQWQRLEAVQAQQGQQINTLTNRVGQLEKYTATPSEEFSTQTIMYKSHLYTQARKYKWPEPAFSEQTESTGFRGQVEVNGESFLGSQVCISKTQAHQEVAKVALQMLATVLAKEEAALRQADQSQTVSQAGPSFFAAVTFGLDVDVSPGVGASAPVDRMEHAYGKLVSLFGLEPPDTGSSNKEEVMKYCAKLKVPPPAARSLADGFVLRLKGQITFHDWEGSSSKAKAEQQAAKAALEALCGVFAKAEVFKDNHKVALKELLEGSKQPEGPKYRVTDGPGGGGERIAWRPAEDAAAGRAEGRPDGGRGNEEVGGTEEEPLSGIVPPMKRMMTEFSPVPSKMTKVRPPTVGSCLAGPSFFAAVTFGLDVDVSPGVGASAPVDRMEHAYGKLVSLFGLEPPDTGSSNKEEVMKYCAKLKVPPPAARSLADGFVLRLKGQITFHDWEGSSSKAKAEQQAAKAALEALCGVFAKAEVFKDNHKVALKELLEGSKQPEGPKYRVTDGPGGGGERIAWRPAEDAAAGRAEGRPDGGRGNEEVGGTEEEPLSGIVPPMKRMMTEFSHVPSKMTKVPPPTVGSCLTDDGRFLSSVQVPIQVDLRPRQAAGQEGAVGAAYSYLMKALSLSPASTSSVGEEREVVLEFFRQTQCPPPVEEIDPTPNGAYCCSLRIDGKLSFQSSERAATKKESEHLVARKALTHLEGLRTVTDLKQPVQGEDNYKGRLQELVVDLSNSAAPEYLTTDAGAATDGGRFLGSVQVPIQVDLRPRQAAGQEGAVGAAYSYLMKALSLSPASTSSVGEEREVVLEFFRQTQCPPPVEEIDPTPNGAYCCSLRIDGKLSFQSSERAATKKESEHLVARKALTHLEGLRTVTDLKQPVQGEDNYKGRLQELVVDLSNSAAPEYLTTDAGAATDVGRFLGSVQVTVQVDLQPHQAAGQEGAVGAAYSYLMKALSLSPAATPRGGERQAVLDFMQQTKCRPPVEQIEEASSGTYQCALKINGQFTFQSPEGSSTKKEAEKLAARQALRHLQGLLSVDRGPLPAGDNYKGQLQELLMARLGSAVPPTYSVADGHALHPL